MKLPYKWLQEYTDVHEDPKSYAARMTMTGSKVEGWESPADEIKNVVVGRVLAVRKHPHADKLVVCDVDVGGKTLQICTGAPNIRADVLVPVALDGAVLPGGHRIETTTMRGELSQGMMCSFAELGLTQNDVPYGDPDGLLFLPEGTPGQDICPLFGLDDVIFDFDITPNRPDCLSVIGLARESAASFGKPLRLHEPVVHKTTGDIRELLAVEIDAPDLCPRYSAAMVKNIKIEPSPEWMRERLRNAGVRPINNIVDITNYVMLEYGQPMHAFDYSCIEQNKIIVRRSRPDEVVTTLDGQQRRVAPETLLITDPVKAVGIAGVMGGENSEITENTKMVVFESATFSGPSVRVASRRIGMRTEASGRFEKGLDCENTMPALLRACELVEMLGAGEIIGGVIDTYPNPKQPRVLPFEPDKMRALIGADIPDADMVQSLVSLGFTVENGNVTVPSWRDDAEGMADLAEEAARMYGYDKIEPTLLSGSTTIGGLNDWQKFEHTLRAACISAGYMECVTLSFLGPKVFDKLLLPQDSPLRTAVVIQNPLGEDQSLMRTTPLHSMLEVTARNYNLRNPAMNAFELSTTYTPAVKDGQADMSVLPEENRILTLMSYGNGDFYSLKGAAEAILDMAAVHGLEVLPCRDNPTYHPGRCGIMVVQGQTIGVMGQIHPQCAQNYGIGAEVYMAEIDMKKLFALRDTEKPYRPLPKYPAVARDLAVVVREDITVLELEKTISAAAGEHLESIALFDVYRGAQVPAGQKSVAFSLAFRCFDRTLTDAEVDAAMTSALHALEKEYQAVLRA